MRSCPFGRALAIGTLLLSLSFTSRDARAHGDPPPLVALALIPLAGDFVFLTYDVIAIADDDRSGGWLTAQAFWMTPQAVLTNALPFVGVDLLGLNIAVSQLTAFGLYGLASPQTSMASLAGVSLALGADLAITSSATALLLDGKPAPTTQAVTEIVVAAPQMILATYALSSPGSITAERSTVLALGAWSGLILAHGVASLALHRPTPAPVAPEHAWTLAPALLKLDGRSTPGLMASGRF